MEVKRATLFEQESTESRETFDSFEQSVIDSLEAFLVKPENGPLLTIDEKDIQLENPERYLDKVSAVQNPRNVSADIRAGRVTREEVAHKGRAKKEKVRKKKDEMFVDRIITATYAADTCRSLFRLASSGLFVPVEEDDDTEQSVQNRVGDYVDDLIKAGRETRLLSGAAMLRTTDKIRGKFDSDLQARIKLTDLAGRNSMKKIDFWMNMLHETSKGFDVSRIDKPTREKFIIYAASRPIEYQQRFNLLQAIANRKNKSAKV
jgi:hypothetical protein